MTSTKHTELWLKHIQEATLEEHSQKLQQTTNELMDNADNDNPTRLICLIQYQLLQRKNHKHERNEVEFELANILNQSKSPLAQPFKPQSQGVISALKVGAYTSKKRVRGNGWLKPKEISTQYYDHYNSIVKTLTQSQDDLLTSLRMLSPYHSLSYPAEIQGVMGGLVFDMVLKEPLIFVNHAPDTTLIHTLKRGETLSLQWSWKVLPDELMTVLSKESPIIESTYGNDPLWQLRWSLVQEGIHTVNPTSTISPDILLYPGFPTLYIDLKQGTSGTVDIGSMSESRLKMLLTAPILPESVLKEQELLLRNSFSDVGLPPVLKTINQCEGIKPTAYLTIQAVNPEHYHHQGLVCVELGFIYKDVKNNDRHYDIPWNTALNTSHVKIDDSILVRDLESERFWVKTLKTMGLSSLVDAISEDTNDPNETYSYPESAPWFIAPKVQFEKEQYTGNEGVNFLNFAHRHKQKALKTTKKTLKQTAQAEAIALELKTAMALQWLEWAETDYQAFKDKGFEVVVDSSMQGFLSTVDNVDIQLSEVNPKTNLIKQSNPLIITAVTENSIDLSDAIKHQHINHVNINDNNDKDKHSDAIDAIDAIVNESNDTINNQWFNLSLGVQIDGIRHNIVPWLPTILNNLRKAPNNPETGLPLLPKTMFLPRLNDMQRFIRLNIESLHPWLTNLLEFVHHHPNQNWESQALQLTQFEALKATSSLGEGIVWSGAERLSQLLKQLKSGLDIVNIDPPKALNATLRPYQQQGLNWLQCLRQNQLSGILADDMGLGKTLQTLSHILVEKEAQRLKSPVLIVAPVSLMSNWAKEAARFTPTLSFKVFHGSDRHSLSDDLLKCDVILTSYALLFREQERWLSTQWHIVVLDEAQVIKNANTTTAKIVSELNAKQRLCLTGTPMENHLGELWSLFHFLMPGFLSNYAYFVEHFRTPIEKQGDSKRLAQLKQRIAPFMLRRTKDLVASELPPKIEHISYVQLTQVQADVYETIRLTTEATVREALANQGLARSHITVLDALLKLRQVCCDPRLVPIKYNTPKNKLIAINHENTDDNDDVSNGVHATHSAKLIQLMTMLPEMIEEGRRILLFSQFTSMLTLIEQSLKQQGLSWVKLTGQTKNREQVIERFTQGDVPLFLISLKAGGVGLNLPQADTVIHYDPWWNPAVENQATDRAHRLGQTNKVFVYKMVAQGTIEERIVALQERKAALANTMYAQDTQNNTLQNSSMQTLLTENDIMELLQPLN